MYPNSAVLFAGDIAFYGVDPTNVSASTVLIFLFYEKLNKLYKISFN